MHVAFRLLTIRESPRPPGLFSTAMCPVCENVAIMQWSAMTRDTIEGPEKT